MTRKTVQNCGRAFWDCFELPLQGNKKGSGKKQEEAGDKEDRAETDRERAFREKREKKQRESRGKDGGLVKMSDDLKGKDLYELLEVEAGCSVEDVKKSYRKLVLVHHPDKMTDPTEEQKQHFLLLQEAFEIVSDTEKRRRYESMLDFDDSIPTAFPKGRYAGLDFYEVFRPVFKRNQRWSARNKIPDLGDASTDIEEVKKFYNFWYDFESWRDPLAIAEKEEYELHALDEAECREEKRWMERENAKVGKKIAQIERDRINDLVKAAEKNDPRMIEYKEKVRQEKEEEKKRRAAAAQAEKDKKEAEARVIREREEVARRVEEAKRQEERKKKEAEKNALKAARQRLRKLHQGAEAVVRHAVHADQLQEVCLRLETDRLLSFCSELEKAFKKDSDDFAKVIDLMHKEIVKCGATPINDPSVGEGKGNNSGASTISPEDSDGEGGASEEDDRSPVKPIREPTPEELEAERLRKQAEEAAERVRAEKRAEEQRKKREAQKKEDEKRQAEFRKQEKKEKEKQAKDKVKEEKKLEQAAKQAEEQKAKQQKMAEEQRLAAHQEEAERKRLHEEQLVARAFETDRAKRLGVLEAYEEGLLDQALRGTLLQEGAEEPNVQLRLALRRLAAQLPSAYASKEQAAEAARREAEELVVDLATACLSLEGGAGAEPQEARARLAGALAVAVRPPREGVPELSKEAKATVKKQRTRVRAAVLSLLRALAASEPVDAAPKPRPAGTTAPPREAVTEGTELIAAEESVIFESASSYDEIGVVSEGMLVVASGSTVEVEGYAMVPIRPRGTVELRILRAVAGSAAAAQGGAAKSSKGTGQKNSKGSGTTNNKSASPAKQAQPDLDGTLRDLVRLGCANLDLADPELRPAFYGSFDPEAAVVAAPEPVEQRQEAAAVAEQAAPAAASKGKKKAGKKEDPEDLDALLQEFGMNSQGSPSKSKKKGGKK